MWIFIICERSRFYENMLNYFFIDKGWIKIYGKFKLNPEQMLSFCESVEILGKFKLYTLSIFISIIIIHGNFMGPYRCSCKSLERMNMSKKLCKCCDRQNHWVVFMMMKIFYLKYFLSFYPAFFNSYFVVNCPCDTYNFVFSSVSVGC